MDLKIRQRQNDLIDQLPRREDQHGVRRPVGNRAKQLEALLLNSSFREDELDFIKKEIETMKGEQSEEN